MKEKQSILRELRKNQTEHTKHPTELCSVYIYQDYTNTLKSKLTTPHTSHTNELRLLQMPQADVMHPTPFMHITLVEVLAKKMFSLFAQHTHHTRAQVFLSPALALGVLLLDAFAAQVRKRRMWPCEVGL